MRDWKARQNTGNGGEGRYTIADMLGEGLLARSEDAAAAVAAAVAVPRSLGGSVEQNMFYLSEVYDEIGTREFSDEYESAPDAALLELSNLKEILEEAKGYVHDYSKRLEDWEKADLLESITLAAQTLRRAAGGAVLAPVLHQEAVRLESLLREVGSCVLRRRGETDEVFLARAEKEAKLRGAKASPRDQERWEDVEMAAHYARLLAKAIREGKSQQETAGLMRESAGYLPEDVDQDQIDWSYLDRLDEDDED